MKSIGILTVAALLAAAPIMLISAEDGAALYESKCSMCHGAKGEGNTAANMPAVQGTAMTAEALIAYMMKGDKTKTIHTDPVGDFNEEQAKAVAEFIKSLKK